MAGLRERDRDEGTGKEIDIRPPFDALCQSIQALAGIRSIRVCNLQKDFGATVCRDSRSAQRQAGPTVHVPAKQNVRRYRCTVVPLHGVVTVMKTGELIRTLSSIGCLAIMHRP